MKIQSSNQTQCSICKRRSPELSKLMLHTQKINFVKLKTSYIKINCNKVDIICQQTKFGADSILLKPLTHKTLCWWVAGQVGVMRQCCFCHFHPTLSILGYSLTNHSYCHLYRRHMKHPHRSWEHSCLHQSFHIHSSPSLRSSPNYQLRGHTFRQFIFDKFLKILDNDTNHALAESSVQYTSDTPLKYT